MPKIIFITPEGDISVEANLGSTVLNIARQNNINLYGGCEGAGVCGGCHVIIEKNYYDKLELPSQDEQDTLNMLPDQTSTSRLGCKVIITKDLDGMRVYLPI